MLRPFQKEKYEQNDALFLLYLDKRTLTPCQDIGTTYLYQPQTQKCSFSYILKNQSIPHINFSKNQPKIHSEAKTLMHNGRGKNMEDQKG